MPTKTFVFDSLYGKRAVINFVEPFNGFRITSLKSNALVKDKGGEFLHVKDYARLVERYFFRRSEGKPSLIFSKKIYLKFVKRKVR